MGGRFLSLPFPRSFTNGGGQIGGGQIRLAVSSWRISEAGPAQNSLRGFALTDSFPRFRPPRLARRED